MFLVCRPSYSSSFSINSLATFFGIPMAIISSRVASFIFFTEPNAFNKFSFVSHQYQESHQALIEKLSFLVIGDGK